MKKIHWKIVMLFAIFCLLAGFGISVWGYIAHSTGIVISGLITIIVVCASWWFWVMFVIRTMIKCTEQTTTDLNDIKIGIKEVRRLIQEYESVRNR